MADKSLVMTFLNTECSRASINLPAVKDTLTETEVSAALVPLFFPMLWLKKDWRV